MIPKLEDDLNARIKDIFRACPTLQGFTIQESSKLPKEIREEFKSVAEEVGKGLIVMDIGIYPLTHYRNSDYIYEEIGVSLTLLLTERPEAKEILSGRTFARTRH